VLARGCSSSSSEASTTFRRRRFAGGAINAIVALAGIVGHMEPCRNCRELVGLKRAFERMIAIAMVALSRRRDVDVGTHMAVRFDKAARNALYGDACT
jgi:hypothetical protein